MFHSRCFVRRSRKDQLRLRPGPFLICERGCFQTDRVVEMCKKTVRILQLINCRTLMRDQPLSINQKLVLFGFSSENGMVLKDQTLEFRAGLPLKEQSRRQSADSPANNDA